jgi:hypothetical protein
MTTEVHDTVAARGKADFEATYRGTGKGGFIPGMPATGETFAINATYLVRTNEQSQLAEHWAWPAPSPPWGSSACCQPPARHLPDGAVRWVLAPGH